MTFNDWDVPVDYERVRAVCAEVNLRRPLKGGQVQEVGKHPYSVKADGKTFRAKLREADQWIERNQKREAS